MEVLFNEIAEKCNRKEVVSLSKKLAKKLSFDSGDDARNLCHLTYWLYILADKELAKKCIDLTHNISFNQNYNVWTFIHFMWGLEIRILREENKNDDTDKIAQTINQHLLTPNKIYNTPEKIEQFETRRRSRFIFEEQANFAKIESCKNDEKSANEWRFIALFGLIGYTETGLYQHLNADKEKIEEIIGNYIKEILK